MHFGISDALIVIYCWIAVSWSLPEESPARQLVKPWSRLVQWLGLWHDWRMFAPNPIAINHRVLVRIDYSDGTRREWRPPFTGEEGPWRAFLFARIRKFMEHVLSGRPQAVQVS